MTEKSINKKQAKENVNNIIDDMWHDIGDDNWWSWYKYMKKNDVISRLKDDVLDRIHEAEKNWADFWLEWSEIEKLIKKKVNWVEWIWDFLNQKVNKNDWRFKEENMKREIDTIKKNDQWFIWEQDWKERYAKDKQSFIEKLESEIRIKWEDEDPIYMNKLIEYLDKYADNDIDLWLQMNKKK
jgi:hypothetical protein